MRLLDFEKEGLQSLHFFIEGMNFPIVAASYDEWGEQQLSYLEANFKQAGFTTETTCLWCINHQIQYRIIYPLKKISIIKNPYKYYKYLQLKKNLKAYSL